MTKAITGLRVLLIAQKPTTGKQLKECFKKLAAPELYFENGSKIGVKSSDPKANFVIAFGKSAEIPDLNENEIYKYIWIQAEKAEQTSEKDFSEDINDPALRLDEEAINLRNNLSKQLGCDL